MVDFAKRMYIGIIQEKFEDTKECAVKCLTNSYPCNEYQELEKRSYHYEEREIFKSPVTPEIETKKERRKILYKY